MGMPVVQVAEGADVGTGEEEEEGEEAEEEEEEEEVARSV